MDRNRFNIEVRPYLAEIPIGRQGIGFDRLELDRWVDDYVARNGRPGRKGVKPWDAKLGSGLIRRGEVWYVDKHIGRRCIRKSTGTGERHEAEMILARWVEEDRLAAIFGVRPKRSIEQAAARFILEHRHKRSLGDDIQRLKNLIPWIGGEPLDRIHMGALQSWIDHRLEQGRAAATINQGLQIVRRIINLAARRWRDENGLTWLMTVRRLPFCLTGRRGSVIR